MLVFQAHQQLALTLGDTNDDITNAVLPDGVRYSALLRNTYIYLGIIDVFNTVLSSLYLLPRKRSLEAIETLFKNEIVTQSIDYSAADNVEAPLTLTSPAYAVLNTYITLTVNGVARRVSIPIITSNRRNQIDNGYSSQRAEMYGIARLAAGQVAISNNTGVTITAAPVVITYLPVVTVPSVLPVAGTGAGQINGLLPLSDEYMGQALAFAAMRGFMDNQEIGSPERFGQLFTTKQIGTQNANISN